MSIVHILRAIHTYMNQPISLEEARQYPHIDEEDIEAIRNGERRTRLDIYRGQFFEGLRKHDDGYEVIGGT